MQNVSQAWKDAQRQMLVPESFLEVNLNVSDPGAQSDAASESNGQTAYSDVSKVVDETERNPVKYATLERNIWVLDGSFDLLPDSSPYGDNGYIGDVLSDDNGEYIEVIPTITILFTQVWGSVIPGLTITWSTTYGEYADTFKVSAYNGDALVAETTVSGNLSLTSMADVDIQGYDRITVEVLKWCFPGRRARIESILLGAQKIYRKADLMSYSHSLFVDPLSAALPKSEITFEIKNLNGEYNPDNPVGAEKYLMERQTVYAKYGYKIGNSVEWIKGGTFFLSEWETPQNGITATFTARDAVEYMTDNYSGPKSGTLMEIAQAAFLQSELPLMPDGTQRWKIDESLSTIIVPSGIELSGYALMEVVQLCANAACCVFYQDRNGMLRIEPLGDGISDYPIDQFVSYENSEISLTKQLKSVDVNNGMFILDVGPVGETQKVDNPLIGADRAEVVARWAANYLSNRKIYTGNYRADPRLDPLDRITNENQFAETIVLVTEVTYTYNGAFRGNYEGRSGV